MEIVWILVENSIWKSNFQLQFPMGLVMQSQIPQYGFHYFFRVFSFNGNETHFFSLLGRSHSKYSSIIEYKQEYIFHWLKKLYIKFTYNTNLETEDKRGDVEVVCLVQVGAPIAWTLKPSVFFPRAVFNEVFEVVVVDVV